MSLFKTNTTKNYSKPARVNNVYGGQKKLRKPTIKKQSDDKIIKAIKGRLITDIKNLFEQEEKDYYKPVRVGNFYSNNYIEYKTNGDRNKTILKDINNLKNSDT